MKKYLILALISMLFASCEKDTENVSFVTTFADFDMKGDKYQSIQLGQSYVEAGVSAKEGDTDLEVKTKGTVDATKVGVYEIVYSAVNSDGFPGSVTRIVAVTPGVPTVDISGKYVYKANPSISTSVTQLAPGFYQMGNIWGASVIPAYIVSANGVDLVLPTSQLSGFGRAQGTGKINGSEMNLVVTLLDQNGLVNIPRNWVKN